MIKSQRVTLTTSAPSIDTSEINGVITAILIIPNGVSAGNVTVKEANPFGGFARTILASTSATANSANYPKDDSNFRFVIPGRQLNCVVSGLTGTSVVLEIHYVDFQQ